ncbi:hypothetical protein ACHAXA_005947 [Cyclostephanos tholiformis]|uniref:Uncharacterized protein n=1 Tax=Cyclostephanos tholiformis TaxID=382380 RepID=A0ABD3SE19_9STRA
MASSSRLYARLYWFCTITTLMSGGLGFLLKVPGIYRPDAYIIVAIGSDGREEDVVAAPGTGTTPFEICATYVFAIVYLGPLLGMTYAHVRGGMDAKRAAIMMPLVYHLASTVGVVYVFPHALNPDVAPIGSAAGMHAFYAVLFALLWYYAEDDMKSNAWSYRRKHVIRE